MLLSPFPFKRDFCLCKRTTSPKQINQWPTVCMLIAGAILFNGTAHASAGVINVNLGDLPQGVTVHVYYQATVNSSLPAANNSVSNQLTVSGTNFASIVTDDPDVGGATDPTVTAVPTANLATTLSASVANVPAAGTPFTYTLTVTNNGPDAADNVVATLTLDPELNYQSDTCMVGSAPGNVFTLNVGTLANTASATCDIEVLADNPLIDTEVVSTGAATTSTDDPVPSNDSEMETTPVATGEVQ